MSLSSLAPLASVLALLSLQPGCLFVADGSSGSSPSASAVIGVDRALDDPVPSACMHATVACPPSAHGPLAASPNTPSRLGMQRSPQFVYAANQNSHDVSAYAVNASGSLTPIGAPVAVGKYPDAIALRPTGTGLFVANHGSSSVSSFKVDAITGALTSTGPAIATAAAGPTALLVHPAGNFVYAGSDDPTSQTPNLVTAYQVDSSTGSLTAIGASETGSAGLAAMVTDPSGRFLFTANTLSDDVTAFSIDACTGALSKVGGYATSAFPVSLTVDPSGEFLYVGASGKSPVVQTFAIDAFSGALNQVESLTGVAPPWGLRAVQVDATGRFLFLVAVGQASAATISTLVIDPLTGIPSAALGSSVPAGTNAVPVAVDPSGHFAYVGNFGSNDISAYSLDGGPGTFTAIGTFAAGTAPGALAISVGRSF